MTISQESTDSAASYDIYIYIVIKKEKLNSKKSVTKKDA
jgi:hypothetical protein